jgi:hypothetical protein
MSMHKIFFGTIVFFSLAFLAACGGGGSGSSGATGAAGAAGADGTIAVPSADSDLTLTDMEKDMDVTKLELAIQVGVSGLDNLTADSRQRYYVYEGTSATAKRSGWDPGTKTTVLVTATTNLSTGVSVYTQNSCFCSRIPTTSFRSCTCTLINIVALPAIRSKIIQSTNSDLNSKFKFCDIHVLFHVC